ncbi:helix-turn-helix transcriptional regulator [Streptomyces smaragdinus]|uniref:helix-turn-helix transcriptional regulator n=1 Tax=Streptomyces smaragdinus TaxID=2585196 RepID=UPI0012962675|nr:LuxR family transcriptional regulator [Streptomyces smaragdinus]
MIQGLFGREDALAAVGDLMDRGGSVVTVGDPGVGKSRLLQAAAELARGQGRRVLSVAPTEFEKGLPFAGLAELTRHFPEGADQDLPGPQRRALAVALQRAEPGGGEVDPLAVPLAVRSLFSRLCESEPVALIIDDLQWLDQATVGSLGFALRGLLAEPRRLSVLIATRPDPETGTELLRCLAEPRHEFALRPLTDDAVGRLLRTRLGPEWTPPLSAEVARASGGNPFLALEIARASGPGRVHVPPSLAELLDERVARLTGDTREVLLLASAAGRLTVTQAQAVVERDRLWPALEAAVDEDMVNVGAGSVITFTHPLLASAVYDAATAAERRRAHRALADTLEDPVERARHRAKSTSIPDETVAADLERAAELSTGRGARQVAGELLEGAALATVSDPVAGLARWLRAVDTYSNAGDATAARAALCKGKSLAVSPEQQAQVKVRWARLAEDVATARSRVEQVLDLAPAGSAAHADALGTLAAFCRMLGDGPRALEAAREAVTEATALGRADLRLKALTELMVAERHWGVGRGTDAGALDEIDRLAEEAGLPPSLPAAVRGFGARWTDPAAETQVRGGIAQAVEAGRYGDLSLLYIALIIVLVRRSKVRDAEAALQDAASSGAWAASGDWSEAFNSQEDMAHALVYSYAGELDEARLWARRGADRPQVQGSTYWRAGFLAQLGFVEASARDWPAALEVLREVAGIFERTGMVDLEGLLWGVDYADAALQLGETKDVEAAVAVLRRQGAAGSQDAEVAARRCQALLTAARGDTDTALKELLAVVGLPDAECPFEAARSRLALGQVYRRAGFKGKANQALDAAAGAFEALGIPRWAQRARDEAGRVGLRPTTSTLTETERRVAELVAAGRSNQETAAELFMSVKTVEANLTRIYRKLSVRSRTELANRLPHTSGS